MPIQEIHNSHLTAYRKCPKVFEYKYIRNLEPKHPDLPLSKGIWIHYCLQAQFLRWGLEDETLLATPESIQIDGVGPVYIDQQFSLLRLRDPEHEDGEYDYDLSAAGMLKLLTEQVWSRLMPEEQQSDKYSEGGLTLPEICKRVMEEYFYHYKDEFFPKRKREILLVEVEARRELEGTDEVFEGRIDYVVRDHRGLVFVGDWKTTKGIPSGTFKLMESQLHLYPWIIEPLLEEHGLEIAGVEFDYIYSMPPTVPSQNKDGSLSKRKINTTYLTLTRALTEYGKKWTEKQKQEYLNLNGAEHYVRKPMPRKPSVTRKLMGDNAVTIEQIRELETDPEKYATRTVSRDCDWCDFRTICKGELYGEDVRHLIKTEFQTRTDSRGSVVEYEDD